MIDLSPLWADLATVARDTAAIRGTLCLCAALAAFVAVGLLLVVFALLPGAIHDLWKAVR